jgi:hypothetical protein
MTNIKEKIIKQLKAFDVEIFDSFKNKDEDIIISSNLTISVKNKEVFINFNIDCSPSYAARIILVLMDIKDVNIIMVGDDYIFDENGKLLDGIEAKKFYEEFNKQSVIKDFMKQQTELYYLANIKPFHC